MKSIILRVLFIIAIIIIVIFLAFAIIRFIPAAFSSFANVGKSIASPFTNRTSEILVEANQTTINDGDEFAVYWDYSNNKNTDAGASSGEFFLNYPCIKDLKVNVVYEDENRRLLCNTKYPMASDSIQLEAELDRADSFVDLPIQISFVEQDTENVEATGEVVITVSNSNTPIGSNAGTATIIGEPITNDSDEGDDNDSRNIFAPATQTTTTYPAATTPVISSAPADLAISNAFAINDLTVQFDIYNVGGRPSGIWMFNYATPDEDVENSPLQRNLNPGEGIRFTLSLDSSDSGVVAIAADSGNTIYETNELNNVATIRINGGGSNGSGNYSYDSGDDADLEIEELEVGRMNGSRFVEDDEIDEDDDAAIRFVVVNRGGESTGSWRFEINDTPYSGSNNDFRSSRQDSLRPGQSVEIIVEFENPDEGRYDIEVEVDSDDDVDEERENNNDESERLEVRD